jgi:hypothetical protein
VICERLGRIWTAACWKEPHLILEGMLIGAYAVGSDGVSCTSDSTPGRQNVRWRRAGARWACWAGTSWGQLRRQGRPGSGPSCAGSLPDGLVGKVGEPRVRTCTVERATWIAQPLDNVETWANVPDASYPRPAWFAARGGEARVESSRSQVR